MKYVLRNQGWVYELRNKFGDNHSVEFRCGVASVRPCIPPSIWTLGCTIFEIIGSGGPFSTLGGGILQDQADGHSGMLIDLDLAKEVGSGRSGARHQTGTMEFMAIEVLLNIDHTYRHDLESFLYVLIWQCARHGWGKNNHPKDSKLRAWYTGNYEDIANAKLGHMSKAENMGFGFILREFPPKFRGVLTLCGALRDILFPYNDKGLIVGTPQDPNRLYDPIIKAYDDTIAQFELKNLTSDKSV
ncbi:predicted protein [Histoplasma mississippiense (nom. inval.)]|uniref:predicted protein n=1 Tax=Ajellomyces capsulatus (strain NAm1 / WU24) TaxID=2059318 RepID=UPI000157B397|nr:predicted protein [Histoplasma mississippiense (nom. inval.)]EDN02501.1 predicted protein [Histoplasma mississippiense (nom. inval.)]